MTVAGEIIDAFVAAGRQGEFEGLLAVLDPDVVLRADDGVDPVLIVQGARAVVSRARLASTAHGPPGTLQFAGRVRDRPRRAIDPELMCCSPRTFHQLGAFHAGILVQARTSLRVRPARSRASRASRVHADR